jgi:hypothetical protein
MQGSLTERVHMFGPDESLMGIVTLPPVAQLESSMTRPFILMLNAGLVHRVGPFGMSVRLARRLAERGFRVLRFDQAGLGDSGPRPNGSATSIRVQVEADGRAAMDFLTARYEATGFATVGLCSGALNAHRIALADQRVVGMCLLDGYAYPTRHYYREKLVRRIARGVKTTSSWQQMGQDVFARVKTKLATLGSGSGSGSDAGSEPAAAPDSTPISSPSPLDMLGLANRDERQAIFYADWPPDAPSAQGELERILLRGCRAFFAYTAGWSSFVDLRQFDEMFPRLPRRDQIRVMYYPRADHTYLALDDRAQMFRDVEAFLGTVTVSSSSSQKK